MNPEQYGRAPLIKAFWSDGWGWLSLVAPLGSATFTALKLWGVGVPLERLSYAWAMLPLVVWLAIAYYRRWRLGDELATRLEPKLSLDYFISHTEARPNGATVPLTFLHIVVTNTGVKQLANCEVSVSAVERHCDGAAPERRKTKAFFLVTAGGPEGRLHQPSAVIHFGRPQHFDVLLAFRGEFGFAPEIRVPHTVPHGFVSAHGIYKIDVVATADETAPAFGTLCVEWRGAADAIKAWMEPGPPAAQ